MKRYIVGLGEALWDMLPEGKQLGGAPANFAYHAAQFGLDAVAISALGHDELADETIAALQSKGLCHIMPRVGYPTGTVKVELDRQGVPTYDICENVAWDNIPLTDEIAEVARCCRAVCFGSLAQRSSVSRATIQSFLKATPDDSLRIFDINLRQHFYTEELIRESLRLCNVLKINDEELRIVSQMFGYADQSPQQQCRHIAQDYSLHMVVLTCGTDGSYVFSPEDTSFQPTPKVEVADTVGAGDSFAGSFCAAILSGKSIKEAHRIAAQVSAYVCTQHGAMPLLPDTVKK